MAKVKCTFGILCKVFIFTLAHSKQITTITQKDWEALVKLKIICSPRNRALTFMLFLMLL